MLCARFQVRVSSYGWNSDKSLESRVYFVMRESYNDINIESHKLLMEFMEDMKKKYRQKDKQKEFIFKLYIEENVSLGSSIWKLLETLTEKL